MPWRVWDEPDHLAEVGHGAVVIALVAEGDSSEEEGGGGAGGIEPDCLRVVGDGAVKVAPFAISGSSMVVVNRQIGTFPFPRIDALRAVNDRGPGVLRAITRVSGGRIAQEYHGAKKRGPKSPIRGDHAIS
jgi:hypothetical protein